MSVGSFQSHWNNQTLYAVIRARRFKLFLDLSKAFEVINHDWLLAKLEFDGLRRKIHEWMTSYLTNRFQYVEIYYQDHVSSCSKSFTSNLNEIKRSVPQGSVFGATVVSVVHK
jgi:uncharacterized membrane protein